MIETIGALMHKNIRVADILFVDWHPVEIREIYEKTHLPPIVDSAETFVMWLEMRNMPYTRPFSDAVLKKFKIRSGADYAGISHNASVTDCYWFASAEELSEGVTWDMVNPRKVEWSDSGEALFIGHPELADNLECPDFATGGYLPKVWVRQPDNIFLLKRDGADGLNVYAEIAATQVAMALRVSHVPYFFSVTAGEVCSGCPCAVASDDVELIPFGQIIRDAELYKLPDFINNLGIEADYARMQVLDFLIGNWHRSLDDFAIMRSPDTLEVFGMAPLYDHGDAFMFTDNETDMRKMIAIARSAVWSVDHMKMDADAILSTLEELRMALRLQPEQTADIVGKFEERIKVYNSIVS